MKHIFSTIVAVMLAVTGFSAGAADWYVSGAGAILNGKTWDHSAAENKMVQQTDGTYKLEVTGCVLEVGSRYEWLVTDGTNWIKTGGNDKGSNFVITVTETATYTVVYSFDGNETASAVVTKTGAAGEVTHTYSVAGSPAEIFGASWDPTNTGTDMTKNSSGIYEWTSPSFIPGPDGLVIEFKVVEDHAWAIAYPSENYVVEAPEGGPYTLTITFNPTNKEVNANLNEGDGGGGDTHTYSVAGNDAEIFGAEWDATQPNDMALNATSGLYEWTSASFNAEAAREVQLKVVEDHSWDVSYPDGYDVNHIVSVPAGGPYNLKVTFDATSKTIGHELIGDGEITHTYSVAGQYGDGEVGSEDAVFVTKWNPSETATSMTKGGDGIYTWTSNVFNATEDGEVQFKVVQDGTWLVAYPAENYVVPVYAGQQTLTVTFNPDTKEVSAQLTTSGIEDIINGKSVKDVKYYNLVGAESNEPFAGINVVVTTWSDGSKSAQKVVR